MHLTVVPHPPAQHCNAEKPFLNAKRHIGSRSHASPLPGLCNPFRFFSYAELQKLEAGQEASSSNSRSIRRRVALQNVTSAYDSKSYGFLFNIDQELKLSAGPLARSLLGPEEQGEQRDSKKARH
eukprot:1141667-Pelagomonas_calceolata.AAC.2